jgi:hypothetical protein
MVTKKKTTSTKSTSESHSKAAKLADARKKAAALLTEWVDQEADVLLIVGPLKFFGVLVKSGEGPDNVGNFMFKSSFGVSALVFLVTFDEISVNTYPSLSPTIHLSHSLDISAGFVLTIVKGLQPKPEQIIEVHEQFHLWSKLQINVQVHVSDAFKSSIYRCSIKEASPQVFAFKVEEADILHLINVEQSSQIEVIRKDGNTTITLHNRSSNSYLLISDVLGNL